MNNKPLNEYVSFYFNPKNYDLYSKQKGSGDWTVILEIKKEILLLDNVIFTNKSVRTNDFCFADNIKDLLNYNFINWDEVFATSWSDVDENIEKDKKYKTMAGIFVPNMVPSYMVAGIVCANSRVYEEITKILNNNSIKNYINISCNPSLFFDIKERNMVAIDKSHKLRKNEILKMSLEDYKNLVEACLNEQFPNSSDFTKSLMNRYESDFEEFLQDAWRPNVAATAMVMGYVMGY